MSVLSSKDHVFLKQWYEFLFPESQKNDPSLERSLSDRFSNETMRRVLQRIKSILTEAGLGIPDDSSVNPKGKYLQMEQMMESFLKYPPQELQERITKNS